LRHWELGREEVRRAQRKEEWKKLAE